MNALRSVAEAIALADGFTSVDATVLVGFKAMPVWQSRLPHARAAVAAYLASADTRPKGGDSTEIEAPFTGGAVPHVDEADAQTPSRNLSSNNSRKV